MALLVGLALRCDTAAATFLFIILQLAPLLLLPLLLQLEATLLQQGPWRTWMPTRICFTVMLGFHPSLYSKAGAERSVSFALCAVVAGAWAEHAEDGILKGFCCRTFWQHRCCPGVALHRTIIIWKQAIAALPT